MFLNTTDPSTTSDTEIFQENIELPQKVHALIAQQDSLEKNQIQDSVASEVPKRDEEDNSPKISNFSILFGADRALIDYNLGVLDAVEEHHFPIHSIGGAGWGGVVAALWAMGYRSQEIKEIIKTSSIRARSFEAEHKTLGKHLQIQLEINDGHPQLKPASTERSWLNPREYQMSRLFAKFAQDQKEGYDSLRVPLFIVASSYKTLSPVLIEGDQWFHALKQSLTNFHQDSVELKEEFFDGSFYKVQVPKIVKERYQTRVVETILKSNSHLGPISQSEKFEIHSNIDSSKSGLQLRYFPLNTEISGREKGYIDFSNRLSSIYRMSSQLKRDWTKRTLVYQDNLVFKGLDLSEIPAEYHSHIQSFFPLLKDDQLSFVQVESSLQELINNGIYQDLKAEYIYDSLERAYRVKLSGIQTSPIDLGLGAYYNYQQGLGLAGYYHQRWVSQFAFDIYLQGIYTEHYQQGFSQLETHIGAQQEWTLYGQLTWEDWEFNQARHQASQVDVNRIQKGKSQFGFTNNQDGLKYFSGVQFINQSFTTDRTLSDYLDRSNPFAQSEWVEFKGLEVIGGFHYEDLTISSTIGTRSQVRNSEAEKPLILQPKFMWNPAWKVSSLMGLEIEPRFQVSSSNKYETFINQDWEFRDPYTGFAGKSLDPTIDSLMRAQIEVGTLSSELWDTRYYADQYIAIEVPISLHFGSFSTNFNPMAVLMSDQPGLSTQREWYALESFLQWETQDLYLQGGVELSSYRKWREDNPQEARWLARIGLRRF